jgi:hypothetical protein
LVDDSRIAKITTDGIGSWQVMDFQSRYNALLGNKSPASITGLDAMVPKTVVTTVHVRHPIAGQPNPDPYG